MGGSLKVLQRTTATPYSSSPGPAAAPAATATAMATATTATATNTAATATVRSFSLSHDQVWLELGIEDEAKARLIQGLWMFRSPSLQEAA